MKSIIFAISVLFFAGPTFANTINCKNFESTIYAGDKKGSGYQGPLTVKFDNKCKPTKNGFFINYRWIVGTRVYTNGSLLFKGEDQVKYKNGSGGSRGLVFIDGDKLHWKNVFTGNSYNVHLTKQ